MKLPEELRGDADQAIVRARYQADVDLGAAPHRQALYLSGVIGRVRVSPQRRSAARRDRRPAADAPRGLAGCASSTCPKG